MTLSRFRWCFSFVSFEWDDWAPNCAKKYASTEKAPNFFWRQFASCKLVLFFTHGERETNSPRVFSGSSFGPAAWSNTKPRPPAFRSWPADYWKRDLEMLREGGPQLLNLQIWQSLGRNLPYLLHKPGDYWSFFQVDFMLGNDLVKSLGVMENNWAGCLEFPWFWWRKPWKTIENGKSMVEPIQAPSPHGCEGHKPKINVYMGAHIYMNSSWGVWEIQIVLGQKTGIYFQYPAWLVGITI